MLSRAMLRAVCHARPTSRVARTVMAFHAPCTVTWSCSFSSVAHSYTASVSTSSLETPTADFSTSHGHGWAPFTAAQIRHCKGYIIDMDGVLYYQQKLIPGALQFIDWLKKNNKKFVFLTNSSERSPRELQEKLARLGIHVPSSHFYTSALATASFLAKQKPNGSAYVIGEPGLISALYDAGYSMNDSNPDYVVVGETKNYNYPMLEVAVKLIRQGARLIGTNCDIADRTNDSFIPACGSLTKPIELASGRTAYYIGKPNPIIMRAALAKLGTEPAETCIIGDRLDTDILAGLQTELKTVLLLTGVTSLSDVSLCAYRPDCILPSLGHILMDGHEVTETRASASSNTSSTSTLASASASASASSGAVPSQSPIPAHGVNNEQQ